MFFFLFSGPAKASPQNWLQYCTVNVPSKYAPIDDHFHVILLELFHVNYSYCSVKYWILYCTVLYSTVCFQGIVQHSLALSCFPCQESRREPSVGGSSCCSASARRITSHCLHYTIQYCSNYCSAVLRLTEKSCIVLNKLYRTLSSISVSAVHSKRLLQYMGVQHINCNSVLHRPAKTKESHGTISHPLSHPKRRCLRCQPHSHLEIDWLEILRYTAIAQ